MFILGSCDIGFLCSNMRIEANEAIYDMSLTNHDFGTQVERHEEKGIFEEWVDKCSSMNENVHRWLV